MYVFLHPNEFGSVLAAHPDLLRRFVLQEEDVRQVLLDALLQRSVWATTKWSIASSYHRKHPELQLVQVLSSKIRVRGWTAAPWSASRRTWRESPETSKMRRRLKRASKRKAGGGA